MFGGTNEGRILAELLQSEEIPALVCVASEYGEGLLSPGGTLHVHTGRLDAAAIASLLKEEHPRTVIDATHPYARSVSEQVEIACGQNGTPYIRVKREPCAEYGYAEFDGMDDLLVWVSRTEGVIFSALGAKEASALTAIPAFRERVWLRILPSIESLSLCLKAGYPAKHIICMQGPFSKEMNMAALKETRASVLLTKESGAVGGFPEKLAAAKELDVSAVVLKRPAEDSGLLLSEIVRRIKDRTI